MLWEDLKLLGQLNNYEIDDVENIFRFQAILDKVAVQHKKRVHPRKIIEETSLSCEELLDSCSWGGKVVNCSTIFQQRYTYEGFCCTFNYIKPFYGM